MTEQYYKITIDNGQKSFVGDKIKCAFWYTQQPENAISIEPCIDDFSGAIELAVYIEGGFACGFSFDNLNDFYEKFFDRYITEHEDVQQIDKEKEFAKQKKIKSIGLEHGYGLIDWR